MLNYGCIDTETDGLDIFKSSELLVSYAMQYNNGENKYLVAELVHHPENTADVAEQTKELHRRLSTIDILVNHNLKFDINVLKKHFEKFGLQFPTVLKLWDTQIAEYILSYQQHQYPSLNDCLSKYGLDTKTEGVKFSSDVTAKHIEAELLLKYNKQDVVQTVKLFKKQYAEAIDRDMVNIIYMASTCVLACADMEYNGMLIDTKKLEELKELVGAQLSTAWDTITASLEYPINFSSPQQVRALLFGGSFTVDGVENTEKDLKVLSRYKQIGENKRLLCLKCNSTVVDGVAKCSCGNVTFDGSVYKIKEPIVRYIKSDTRKGKTTITLNGLGFSTKNIQLTTSGQLSTDSDTIKALKPRTKAQKDFISAYSAWAEAEQIYSTYLQGISSRVHADGLLHHTINQTRTATGRMSCSNPNLQNIPRSPINFNGVDINIKDLFISRYKDGRLLEVDLAQIEWRVAAWLSNDMVMIQEILDGIDAHIKNASIAFKIPRTSVTKAIRTLAKMVSFGILYGNSAYGMANFRPDIPVNTEEEAQAVIDAVYGEYKTLQKWHSTLFAQAQNGKAYKAPSGREYHYGIKPKKTKSYNYPVQGTAADIMQVITIAVYNRLKDRSDVKMVNTVHDCLMFDCKDEATAQSVGRLVHSIMSNANELFKAWFAKEITVPISAEVEIGATWGQKKEYHI